MPYSHPCPKAHILNAIRESSLHSALISGNASMYRRCALELLGIGSAHDDEDESSSDVSDSDSSPNTASGQSISSSSSEESNDDAQETCADVPVPPPPVAENTNDHRRGKGKVKFCSGFQSGCAGIDSAASKAPQPSVLVSRSIEDEDADESSEASSEDFSDISDGTDIFNLAAEPVKFWEG